MRCVGTTKTGTQCKRQLKGSADCCFQHRHDPARDEARKAKLSTVKVQCQGKTANGSRCKRMLLERNCPYKLCHYHSAQIDRAEAADEAPDDRKLEKMRREDSEERKQEAEEAPEQWTKVSKKKRKRTRSRSKSPPRVDLREVEPDVDIDG